MAGMQGNLIVGALLAIVVLLASIHRTDGNIIKLSDFTVLKLDPAEYQTDGDTQLTFSANLTYEGETPMSGRTPVDISIVFVVLRLMNGGQNIGNASVMADHLQEHLQAGRSVPIRNVRARVRLDRRACGTNASAVSGQQQQQLCAAVHVAGALELNGDAIDCLPLGVDIADGGAGKINCTIIPVVPPGDNVVLIAVPIAMFILLVILIVFLCCVCAKRRRQRDLSDGQRQSDNSSRPRMSMAHIYEDISNRLAKPFRKQGRPPDAESNYEARLSAPGTANDGFQAEIEDADDTATSTPSLTRADRFAKRPSQPNAYILDDSSLILKLSPLKDEPRMRVFIEGIPDGETNDDDTEENTNNNYNELRDGDIDELDDGGYATTREGPESQHATAVDSNASTVMPKPVPSKTGGDIEAFDDDDDDDDIIEKLEDSGYATTLGGFKTKNATAVDSNAPTVMPKPVPWMTGGEIEAFDDDDDIVELDDGGYATTLGGSKTKNATAVDSNAPTVLPKPVPSKTGGDIEAFDDDIEELDDGGYATTLGGPKSRNATAVGSDTPAFAPKLVPLKTGDNEGMSSPDSQRSRAASVDIPLRDAPGLPSDLDNESDLPATCPNPCREEAGSVPAVLPSPPRPDPVKDQFDPDPGYDPELDSPYLPAKPKVVRRPERNPLPHHNKRDRSDSHSDPDPDQAESRDWISDEEKPELPSRSYSRLRLIQGPALKPKPDPDSKPSMNNTGSNRSDTYSNPDADPAPRRSSKPQLIRDPSPDSAPSPDPNYKLSSDAPTPSTNGTSIDRNRNDSYSNPNPDPNQMSNSFYDEGAPLVSPPKRNPKPPVTRKTSPGPRPDPGYPLTNPISVPDPVSIRKSKDEQTTEGQMPSSPSSPVSADGEHKPKLPAKPRSLSEKDVGDSGKPKLGPRPQLPSKPRFSKSDPGIPHDVQNVEDWSSKSTSSASKPAPMHKPLPLSVYKDYRDGVSYFPSVTPKLPKSVSPLQKKSIDRNVMNMAVRSVRYSEIKPPDPDELDIRPDSPCQAAAVTPPTSSSNPDFIEAVMEVYLALMYETSNGEEDFEVAIQREQDRVDIEDGPAVAPRVLMRRKSYSAQLTLRKHNHRKTIQSGDVYVNQWNRHWEFNRAKLTVEREKPLGEGQFGKVYKARAEGIKGHEGITLAAVKELKDGSGMEEKDEFLKELAIHSIMKTHPHVVELLGCCIRDEPICIITEYLSGGSLLGFLRSRLARETGKDLVRHYLARFGLHIARGMAYVSQMKIVHRDLAARNILISEDEVCKVSDFGFARDIFHTGCYSSAPDKAPIRWFAPESILDNLFTTKSDVWSFGVVLFEIATLGRKPPYMGCSNEQVRFQVSAGSHPEKPTWCDAELFTIMEKCWQKSPDDRPPFSELVDLFESVQGQYPDPTKVDDELLVNEEDEEEAF